MRYSHNSHDSKSARANTEALEELTEIDNPLYSCRPPDGTNKWNDVAWNGQIETTLSTEGPHDRFPMHTIRGISTNGNSDHSFVNQTLDNVLSHSTGRGLPLGGKCTECFWDLR
ncbi:hypothetical protein V2W45_154934 [Cenococcum geophilum]